MGYSVFWHVEQRVFVVKAWGDIHLEELIEISNRATELVQAGDAPVHWIADAREIKSIPKSVIQIQKMARVFKEPNLGWVFVLTNHPFMRFATSLVSQLSKVNYRAFQDPETLIATMKLIDVSLSDMPTYTAQVLTHKNL